MKSCHVILLLSLSLKLAAFTPGDTTTGTYSSNPRLWNTLIITSIRNPALAGMAQRHSIYFDYDKPWFNSFDNEFKRNNYNGGYDIVLKTFNNKVKVAAGVYYSGNFMSFSSEQSIGIINSVAIRFKNNSVLGIGISILGVTFKSIEYENMQFGSSFDGSGFNPGFSNGETFTTDKFKSYCPVNVGIWYRAKNFFIGTSSLNLSVPKESYLNQYSNSVTVRTPLVSYTNAGYHFTIKRKVTITPSLQHRTETIFSESPFGSLEMLWIHSFQPRITVAFVRNRFLAGAYYENDAMYFTASAHLFEHWLIGIDAGWYVDEQIDSGMQGFRIKSRVHF